MRRKLITAKAIVAGSPERRLIFGSLSVDDEALPALVRQAGQHAIAVLARVH